jgi:hypothetical protein
MFVLRAQAPSVRGRGRICLLYERRDRRVFELTRRFGE